MHFPVAIQRKNIYSRKTNFGGQHERGFETSHRMRTAFETGRQAMLHIVIIERLSFNSHEKSGLIRLRSKRKYSLCKRYERSFERCLLMTTDPGDLVLDPTCGSGTTAYVAEQWGRRWITCDTSRVALALARTRMMSARYPYYLLADSPDGIKKEMELTGKIPPNTRPKTTSERVSFISEFRMSR